MIRLRAIVGSALAAAIINILGALLIIAALAPESPRLSHQNSQVQATFIGCRQFPLVPTGVFEEQPRPCIHIRRVHAALRTDQVMDGEAKPSRGCASHFNRSGTSESPKEFPEKRLSALGH